MYNEVLTKEVDRWIRKGWWIFVAAIAIAIIGLILPNKSIYSLVWSFITILFTPISMKLLLDQTGAIPNFGKLPELIWVYIKKLWKYYFALVLLMFFALVSFFVLFFIFYAVFKDIPPEIVFSIPIKYIVLGGVGIIFLIIANVFWFFQDVAYSLMVVKNVSIFQGFREVEKVIRENKSWSIKVILMLVFFSIVALLTELINLNINSSVKFLQLTYVIFSQFFSIAIFVKIVSLTKSKVAD